MSAARRTAMPESVLRNVLVEELPHALPRPARLVSFAGVATSGPAHADDTPAQLTSEVSVARTFEEGFAAGYDEGIEAARTAQAAAGEKEIAAAAEQARADAAAEGYAEGLAQGRQAAQDAMQEQRADLARQARDGLARNSERLGAVIDALMAQAQAVIDGATDDLIALSHETICRILGTQAATPASIRAVVDQLLAERAHKEAVRAHVHPADFARLKLLEPQQTRPAWQWVSDEKVQVGGVLLRSPQGDLDARLEVQLDALRRTLLQVRAADARSDEGSAAGGPGTASPAAATAPTTERAE